jgi:hypothetical protein
MELPIIPFGGGLYGRKRPKTKVGKLKTMYTPSLTAAAFGITKQVSRQRMKSLGKKTFTGLEFRPVLIPKTKTTVVKQSKIERMMFGRRKK